MAKLFIIDAAENDRIPFLRGVMVESLVRIGLTFQDAYLLAQQVREGLANETEITKAALRKRVSGELRRNFSASLARAYDLGASQERQIMVRSADEEAPFSVGLLSRSLQACAIDRADALETARKVQEYLRNADTAAIDLAALRKIIFDRLEAHCSRAAAERFISWQGFRDSGLPLIVLVGGITGTGKSTLTTELAYRLNIVRTQSTDMMREIVRCYLPPKKSPTLGYSSFEAWRGLTRESESASKAAQAEVVRGFMSQFELVKHGLQATIARAVKETHDLIVDGVHVLPSRLDLDVRPDQAIVIPLMLVVPNKKTLAKRLKRRAREQPERTSSRYLRQLDQIWFLQSFLVAEAEENNIPLIINSDIDDAMHQLLMQISKAVTAHFPASSRL